VLQHSLSMFAFSLIFVFDALVDFPRVTRDRKLRLVFVGTGSGCKTEIGETKKKKRKTGEVLLAYSTFLRNEHPSVSRALPPVG